jgi:hypothetical protein
MLPSTEYNILDGDIVSAKPVIQISLNDENKFLAMNDIQFLKYLFVILANLTTEDIF